MMRNPTEKYKDAISVAKMYYYQGLTSEQIAAELKISRPSISRLLSFARTKGLVDIKIHDTQEYLEPLEQEIKERFGLQTIHVVAVPEVSGEQIWLQQVASFSAKYLNSILKNNQVLGLAWGTTLSTISNYLIPKSLHGVDIVQLNGSGNTANINNNYASEIIMRFAENYSARAHLFPVPTFFDYVETKKAMWRERSVQRILKMQQRANVLVYSLGTVDSGMPGRVYTDDYLEARDFKDLKKRNVVADIATVFFRANGSFKGIPLNARSSGPDLKLFRKVTHSVCVVSGRPKVAALHSALTAHYMNDLIVDEPTARLLLKTYPKS